MSVDHAQQWLLSQNLNQSDSKARGREKKLDRKAYTVSVTSGKGGVGKTSVAIKSGKILAEKGHKVLIIDCDVNLSNTVLKLGLPISNKFYQYLKGKIKFDECLYKNDNFHLLSACNGDLDFFDDNMRVAQFIINILLEHERAYDFIILDCPAGLTRDSLILNAYCDYRFLVVTPDKSSITDSYSLIKILSTKFGVRNNHLLVNKVSSLNQYKRIVKIMSETVENYLPSRLHILGGLRRVDGAVDLFDKELFDPSGKLHGNFVKVLNRFTEESVGVCGSLGDAIDYPHYACVDDFEQDVQKLKSQGVDHVISL